MRSTRLIGFLFSATCLSYLSSTAFAQRADRAPPQVGEGLDQLDEVLVNAERRSTSVLTTSISMTAIPAQQLENLQPNTSLQDLQSVAPSFTVSGTSGSFENINIRGVGNSSTNPSVTTGVAVIRDGLPIIETNALGLPLFDMRDVEVLRGPQGTFVGASSTGGALLINSADPSLAGFQGYFEGALGNYTERRLNGAVNFPVDDTLAIRFAYNAERRNSFYRNEGSQNLTPAGKPFSDPGHVDNLNARVGALWKPADNFQALLKVELNQSSTGGVPGQPNQNPFPNPLVPGQMQYVPSYAYSTHQPFVLNYGTPVLLNDSQMDRYGLELRYTLPGGIVLRSQTGYQNHYFKWSTENSLDAFNSGVTYTQVGPKNRNYYQEFNVISPDTGKLTWIAGAAWYYRNTPVFLGSNLLTLPIGPQSAGPSPESELDILSVTRNVGLFGQLTYQLLDSLQIQVGARQNWDNNYNGGEINVIGPFGPFLTLPNSGHFKANTPTAKVGINWTPSKDQFVYAFWARGYKSGGVNVATGEEFDVERVDDYEIGLKSRLFDGRVQTQIGAFYMNYKGMQEDIFNAHAGYMDQVVNLANSTINGFEASVQGRLAGLGINAGVSYTDSKLGSVSNPAALVNGGVVASYLLPLVVQNVPALFPASTFDYTPYTHYISGQQNPYSPKFTANVSVDYAIPMGEATVRPVVSFSHTGEQHASIFQRDNFYLVPARNLWNASISYENGPWLTQAYVNNLADTVYISGYSGNAVYYGDPREIGLRVRKSF